MSADRSGPAGSNETGRSAEGLQRRVDRTEHGWTRRAVFGLGALMPLALRTAEARAGARMPPVLSAASAGASKSSSSAHPEVNAAILTPVDSHFNPDVDRLIHHAKVLMADGCDRLILFGTTGEANSFSIRQRVESLDAVLAGGVPADRLIIGAGCPALVDSVTLVSHAERNGCAGVLVLPPYYYKNLSDDGHFAWFSELLERVGSTSLKLYLYHIPQVSGVPITNGLIERLLKAYPDNLAGMKDSSPDAENRKRWIRRYPQMRIFAGNERNLFDILDAGAAGVISAVGNINAAAFRELRDRWLAGERDLEDLQEAIHRVRSAFEKPALIPTLKRVVAARYDDPAWNRLVPPNLPLPEDTASAFLGQVKAIRPELLHAPS